MEKRGLIFAILILFSVIFLSLVVSAENNSCIDSDGGHNYSVSGYAKNDNHNPHFNDAPTGWDTFDFCFYGKINGSMNYDLVEQYCNGSQIAQETYTCPHGCISLTGKSDGACAPAYFENDSTNNLNWNKEFRTNETFNSSLCTDSDGGKNYYVKGYVDNGKPKNASVDVTLPDGRLVTDVDACEIYKYNGDIGINSYWWIGVNSCKNNESQCTLRETFCDANVINGVGINPYNCPNGCRDGACIRANGSEANNSQSNNGNQNNNSSSQISCSSSECSLDGKCYTLGYRKSGNYCSDNNEFISQLETNVQCNNNFECSSNLCVNSQCVSGNLLQKILEWFKNLFGAG